MNAYHLFTMLSAMIASIQSTPVKSAANQDGKESETTFLDIPHGVQDSIVAKLPFKERARLSSLNTKLKHFGTPERIIDDLHSENGKDAINAAFGMGIDNVDVYDALLKTLGPHDGNHDHAAQIAGRRGNMQKLDEWAKKYRRMPQCAAVGAAESGDFDTFRHAYDQRPELLTLLRSVEAAAAKGDSEFLRNVLQEFCNDSYLSELLTTAIDIAAANGHWQTVDDIIAAYPENDAGAGHCFAEPFKHAAGKGDMAMLQKYLDKGKISSHMTDSAYSAAAAGGHMDILRFLDKHKVQPSATRALAEAVKHNQRDAFDYIRQTHRDNGVMIGHAHTAAIRHNRPQYAQELAPLIASQSDLAGAAYSAAERGDIELFNQFLNRVENRGSLVDIGFVKAVKSGHWGKMDEWAQRYPLSQGAVNEALTLAAKLGRIDDVLKIVKTGFNGAHINHESDVMPNRPLYVLLDSGHPTLATAKARLLILAKHQDLRNRFLDRLTPATKLVYADALPDAVAIAEEEEFSTDEIELLMGLEREFQQ